ncbi:alginate export family protein [Marinobacter alexandrii]|uniref:alginate export family protein n=1 Tax=Marinobacter alexandrii TaxID=2570351 RepID=UPI001FFF8F0E|nr:alginate export family protein [Marinobacter alexandrii]MCK2150366.1 alginate export family protein [Marinobacter alexandrii]
MNMNETTGLRPMLLVLGCVAAMPAAAQDGSENTDYPRLLDSSTSAKASAISEGDRRLGLDSGDRKSNELSVDVKPEWVWQLSEHWRSKVRLQGFAATGKVDVSDEIGGTETDGFVGLREAWLDYNGLTSYPGASIRFGRERLKENTGTWWDDDITLARWIFDTTLLKTTVGIADKLTEARTDVNEVRKQERDIARLFASTQWQWKKDHYLTLLTTHAERYGDESDLGPDSDSGTPERVTESLTWVGVRADQGYFDWHSRSPVQYLATFGAVAGEDARLTENPGATNGYTREERDVSGWAADLGLRGQLTESPRWVVGAHGAIASGGSSDGESDAFRQTQLESNRSRFTGTRSQVSRFGEAFQPEWSNLKVATVYTAITDRNWWAANLLYHKYWLADAAGTVNSDLVEPGFTGASDDLGESVDMVLGYYGAGTEGTWTSFDARLRAGVFFPGQAYGEDADDSRHRVVLDLTKRF